MGLENIHFLDARGALGNIRHQISPVLTDIYHQVKQRIPLLPVDICIRASNTGMPEIHVGGGAFEPGLINLYISPSAIEENMDIRQELARTLAHELHHASRWDGPGYGETLGEALVSEGLAGFFAREITGAPPEPWEQLSDAELAPYLNAANTEWDSDEYQHWRWFYGSTDFPRWIGYGIGRTIVSAYMQQTGKTAGELVHAPHEPFHEGLLQEIAAKKK